MRYRILCAALALAVLAGCGAADGPARSSAPPSAVITLNSDSARVEGVGAEAAGRIVTVTESGTYTVRGTLDDGQVVVDAPGGTVTLRLDGVRITCADASPISIRGAFSAAIELAGENVLSNTSAAELNGCLYSAADLTLQGEGTLTITAGPNGGAAVSCEKDLTVTGGRYALTSEDDGLHAEGSLTISGGTVEVLGSYEGLEGNQIFLTGGQVTVVSSDDGVNAAGDGNSHLIRISGGSLNVLAGGDGLDSNGDIEMTGGTVLVSSTGMADGALDCDGSFTLTGGLLLAVSGGNMPAAPAEPEQCTLSLDLGDTQAAGTYVQITGNETELVFQLPIDAVHVVFSSPELEPGADYTVSCGGTYAGGETDGVLWTGGTYAGGQVLTRLTLGEMLTTFGERFQWGGGHGGPPDEFRPGVPGVQPPDNGGNAPAPPNGPQPPEGNGEPSAPPPAPPEEGDDPSGITPPQGFGPPDMGGFPDQPTPPAGDFPEMPAPPEG